jgi:outer membrane protein TolC
VLKAINALGTEIPRKEALAEYYAVLDSADAAYYAVLAAEAALDAAETALGSSALALETAEIRLESGMISYGDYLQALADHAGRETTRGLAKRDLVLSRTRLQNLTGLGALPLLGEIDFDALEPLIQKMAVLGEDGFNVLYTFFLAAARNPGLSRSALLAEQADRNVTLAEKSYFPSISAGFSTGLNYSAGSGFAVSPGRLSLSLNVPLDFWGTANSVAKTKLARDGVLLDYRGAEADFYTEVETALLDAAAQAGSALSARRAWEYSSRHYDYTLELFTLSQSSPAALSDAAALLGSSRSQLIQAQFGFLSCLSKLRSLGGFADDVELVSLLLSV